MGDFNIDLIDCHDTKVENYINVCLENNFVPCITLPTRITDHSATLVDHILLKTSSRLMQNKVTAGNLISGLSDHLPNFLIFDLNIQSYEIRPLIRLFTQERIDNFKYQSLGNVIKKRGVDVIENFDKKFKEMKVEGNRNSVAGVLYT